MNKKKIRIDVVSDVVCPWCYIGKKRLDKAVEQLSSEYDFEINYHPFELNPDIPKEGYNQKEYLINKFGGEDRYQSITGHVANVAKEEGLKFDFDKQTKSPNTLDAHRIIWFASQKGLQKIIIELFFKAYFEEGIDLTKRENLLYVASKAGYKKEEIDALLNTDKGIYEVKTEQLNNRNMGITGVPFYIINNKYGISGAQPSNVFVQALTEIGTEVKDSDNACDIDGNNC